MNEMSEYYRNLKNRPKPEAPKKPPHKGNWTLFFSIGGIKQPVLIDKPYAACMKRKNELQRDPATRRGVFKIEPHKP